MTTALRAPWSSSRPAAERAAAARAVAEELEARAELAAVLGIPAGSILRAVYRENDAGALVQVL